jgi:hypothetical protein
MEDNACIRFIFVVSVASPYDWRGKNRPDAKKKNNSQKDCFPHFFALTTYSIFVLYFFFVSPTPEYLFPTHAQYRQEQMRKQLRTVFYFP